MVTVDTVKLNNDINAFNSMLLARHKLLGGRLPVIVKRQAGLLCRALINLTPPNDKSKLAKKITKQINSKFDVVASDKIDPRKHGDGAIRWFAASKFALYGMQADKDMRRATSDDLYKILMEDKGGKRSNGKGFAMVGMHYRQKVYISQRIITKRKQVKRLIQRLLGHIGRMKAGWSIGWEDCGSPGRALPQWIERHAGKSNGARGYAINGLSTPDAPEFTVANTASGVDETKAARYLSRAISVRTEAMMKDTVFAIKEPEKWSEREAASDANAEE